MAFNSTSQLSKAFKTLINKEFTTPSRAANEEFGANTLNINSEEVWTSPLPTSSAAAVTAGSASLYDKFILTPDPAFPTNVFYFISGSGFTPGSSTYPGNRDKIQRGFIGDKYGASYTVQLFDNSNTPIPPADNIDWFFDYTTGILFVQDPGEGSYNLPYKVTVYKYIGATLPSTLTSFSSSISAVSSSVVTLSGSLSNLSQDKLTTGSVTASLGVGTIAFAINSASLNLFTVDNSGSVFSTSFTSSFSGSYDGDGSSLTNIPASAIIGLNLSQVATGSITASVNIGPNVFTVTSASTTLIGLTDSGSKFKANVATFITGSTLYSASAAAAITSSMGANKYSLMVSQSAWAFNHNVGYPTSNPWKTGLEGSYFYNFDANTDTSEILRFMAGILSASVNVASPVPNGRYYNGVQPNITNNSTTTRPAGYIPANYTNGAITYLVNKGFGSVAGQLFPSQTILASSAYNIQYSSLYDGSTTVSASANGYNLGEKELDYSVSASRSWKFYDSSTISPGTLTFSTTVNSSITNTTPNSTTSGLTRTTILSSNPAVIPNLYQDGFFTNILSTNLSGTFSDFTNISSSGYYEVSASVGSRSGSGTYNFSPSNATRAYQVFWAPVSQIDASIGSNSLTGTTKTPTPTTATSRSLSGAPYLVSAAWTSDYTASGMFDPMYHNGTVATINLAGTGVSQTGILSAATNPNIATANAFYDAAGSPRSTGVPPNVNDTIRLSTTVTFAAPSNASNLQNRSTRNPASYTLTGTAVNRAGNSSNMDTETVAYHEAGTMGQNSTSGSMAYYGRTDGTDSSNSTFGQNSYGYEYFTGETYRRKISDNILTFDTSSAAVLWNSASLLGTADLQVTPKHDSTTNGRLVDPGASAGYWYASGFGSTTKFYIRLFQYTSLSDLGRLIVDLGTTLNKWSDTSTNGFAIAALLEQQRDTGTGATLLAWDPGAAATVGPNSVSSGLQNPFSSTVNIIYNPSTAVGTTYPAVFVDALGQKMKQNDKVYLIVRLINTAGSSTSISQLGITGI